MKHSKIKNTGLLFESLSRQITNSLLESKDDSKHVNIIKTFFTKNSQLRKDLDFYNILLNKKFKNESIATDFVNEMIVLRKKIIIPERLNKQKYNIIKEIKENYNIGDFFGWRIKEYTAYANVYRLFELSLSSLDTPKKVEEYSEIKQLVVNNILQKKQVIPVVDAKFESYKSQTKDIKLLSYKIILDNFNKKYSDALNKKQINLLKEFVYYGDNKREFKKILVESIIPDVKNELNKSLKIVKDKVIIIKLNSLQKLVSEKFNLKNKISENDVIGLMRIYELTNHIMEKRNENNAKTI